METTPTFEAFKQMARQNNLIPVWREFLADTETPVSAYLKVRDDAFSYLLESAGGGHRWGRYSFIGYRPMLTVTAKDQDMEIADADKTTHLKNVENPLVVLRKIAARFKAATVKGLAPFQGGLVGYCNYDMVDKWEPLGQNPHGKEDAADAVFMAARRLIIFDHFTHKIKVVVFAHLQDEDDIKASYEACLQDTEETMDRLQAPLSPPPAGDGFSYSGFASNFDQADFMQAVQTAKDYIVAGDAIQVVLSQCFSSRISGDDFTLYRNLRSVNPSPYMFYLNFGENRLIGASPEILVRLTDGHIELRPIAGTRPRGKDEEEDLALEKELLADPKERAEHIMLVDLGRNDAGKVSRPATVSVPQFMEIERYSHVMHIVSGIEGELKPDMDAFDLFMSAFPAGTVSGAPKVRAMQIIRELEPTNRGPYAGAVGYFGFNGNMDFCITIRTITLKGERLSIQVGAGIVYDSSPEGEYQETLRKAAAMFKAVEQAQTK